MGSFSVVEVQVFGNGFLVRSQCLWHPIQTFLLQGTVETLEMTVLRWAADMRVPVLNIMGDELFAEVLGEFRSVIRLQHGQ